LNQTAQLVKQQSVEAGDRALDRMGIIAMWLAALAIITLGLSITGGMIGTPTISEMGVEAEQYRDRMEIRRAS
jgi:hypothetical protein